MDGSRGERSAQNQLRKRHRMATAVVIQKIKALAKNTFYPQGSHRKAMIGPYRGITFEICPQMETRMIVFYSAYEVTVSRLLEEHLRPGMTVFNVGAHIGIHALYISKLLRRAGRVFAFEPWDENYAVLSRNVVLNVQQDFAPIQALHTAVSNEMGFAPFCQGKTDGQHHLYMDDGFPVLDVPVTTIDYTVAEWGYMPDFLLVDVEGAELQVIEGALRTIQQKPMKMILEMHTHRDALCTQLSQMDYEVKIYPRHLLALPRGIEESRN